MKETVTYEIARTEEDFASARELFREYALQLGIDFSFQHFDEELEQIGRQYAPPDGGLVLALVNGLPAGCAGVRRLEGGIAELKRMYVRNSSRGLGIGAGLLEQTLSLARGLGYEKIRLDTLEPMTRARDLYAAAGFYPIPPYRYNPLPGVIYMEKALAEDPAGG